MKYQIKNFNFKSHENILKGDDDNEYNKNSKRILKKKVLYSKDKDNKEKKEVIINQKKNIYYFIKRTDRKESFYNHRLSDEKADTHNKSFKGFSSIKKLEQIKKKYKFFPLSKERKSLVKERLNYIEETNKISRLLNSMDVIKYDDEAKNLNLTEFIPEKEYKHNDEEKNDNNNILSNNENLIIMEDFNIQEDDKNEDIDNDILNHRSFILDLNNVIPINEKKLMDTFKKNN